MLFRQRLADGDPDLRTDFHIDLCPQRRATSTKNVEELVRRRLDALRSTALLELFQGTLAAHLNDVTGFDVAGLLKRGLPEGRNLNGRRPSYKERFYRSRK